ncbi:GntR family transcriptional regulator [Paenibacillus sp. MWE-103]|uniref:GntR family transcriptional regulator n=1 Tax=Paenibacillus artemisiicola TaxID=1172618 RepID=A0ABS3W522_9BACL|nr:GntR family transcriptional regulator [Paenibacillus artemisiicola]MBO7743397.1 GntR family transcriptional regulator [Paenibacillus artemisiicola]
MGKNDSISPKYQQVKDYVLTQIENNALGKDGRIPSESEFSQLLDVSSITVRKALNELVNEGVIYRVRGKGSFVSNRGTAADAATRYVTFIISGNELYDSSYLQITKGVQSFLSQQGCKLIIEFVENNFEQERELIMKLIQSETRGLLIYSVNPNAAKTYLHEIRKKSIPFVMLDRIPSGFPVDCITCNNNDGAYEAVAHLIAHGHRNIGFAAYDFYLSAEAERYNGYQRAMQDASLVPNDETLFFRRELDYDKLIAAIKNGELTALFCVNDRRALEIIERLTQEGIRIPEEISIMGFDDFESSKFAKVPLSTVRQNFEALGYEGARLLFELGGDAVRCHKKILLSTSLVIRESIKEL